MELGVTIEGSDEQQCEYCFRKLDEFETEVFDSLPDLEDKLNDDTMTSYVTTEVDTALRTPKNPYENLMRKTFSHMSMIQEIFSIVSMGF